MDDGAASAEAVALALAERCKGEYQKSTEKRAAAIGDDKLRNMFQAAQRIPQSKLEVFLPVVKEHRANPMR